MATAEQIAALYRSNFSAFVRFAFRERTPGQRLVEAPQIDVLADHLARVARGEITRLIINMPPRSLEVVRDINRFTDLAAWQKPQPTDHIRCRHQGAGRRLRGCY